MRFAWLKENSDNYVAVEQGFMHPLSLIRKTYNVVFWFFLLPFFTLIDYGTGFVIYTVIIAVRLVLNLYTNNVLDQAPERYYSFPFRMP
jgi:hypothetical protein